MLKNYKLGIKLNLLLVSIFLVVVILNGVVLSVILQNNAQDVITDKAFLLIETMGSVRNYTSNEINPELKSRLETEDQFLPQTVPAYAAREVFEDFRNRAEYKSFFYKEATLNPTNLRDKADEFETTIVDKFRNQPNLKEQTGFRSLPGGDIFYIARPIAITQESCLRCHSTPEAAPKSQLATYGDQTGFGWKLNEIVGAKIVSVPAGEVFEKARQLQIMVIGLLSLFLLIAVILINIFVRFTITTPLTKMAQSAKKVSTGDMSVEFEHDSKDEIGVLAASLNRMKISLQIAMNMIDEN